MGTKRRKSAAATDATGYELTSGGAGSAMGSMWRQSMSAMAAQQRQPTQRPRDEQDHAPRHGHRPQRHTRVPEDRDVEQRNRVTGAAKEHNPVHKVLGQERWVAWVPQ
jgi:hypothetical protein